MEKSGERKESGEVGLFLGLDQAHYGVLDWAKHWLESSMKFIQALLLGLSLTQTFLAWPKA